MTQILDNTTKESLSPGQILQQRLAKYNNIDSEAVQAFGNFIDTADKYELCRLNPRRVAAKAAISLQQAIEIAALSVREGIFDLLWQYRCLACGMEMRSFHNLEDAPAHALSCQACQKIQDNDFDHHIQVSFSLNPAVRVLDVPSMEIFTEVGTSPTSMDEFMRLITPAQLDLLNTLDKMSVEHSPLTGLELVHNQLFRDFFKNQVLPVNVSLKVTRVALIFTDLRGSTALYAAKGDPAAYELVRRHFDLLTQETMRYGGVVIKTIGDAVMASFLNDLDAAKAAAAYHKIIEDFNHENNFSPDDALILKVGLHSGSCLSVNLNNVLDYFGTTVNMAARIGALSKGDDVIISATTLAMPEVRATFEANNFTVGQSMRVKLRGLTEETEVYSLTRNENAATNQAKKGWFGRLRQG